MVVSSTASSTRPPKVVRIPTKPVMAGADGSTEAAEAQTKQTWKDAKLGSIRSKMVRNLSPKPNKNKSRNKMSHPKSAKWPKDPWQEIHRPRWRCDFSKAKWVPSDPKAQSNQQKAVGSIIHIVFVGTWTKAAYIKAPAVKSVSTPYLADHRLTRSQPNAVSEALTEEWCPWQLNLPCSSSSWIDISAVAIQINGCSNPFTSIPRSRRQEHLKGAPLKKKTTSMKKESLDEATTLILFRQKLDSSAMFSSSKLSDRNFWCSL